MDDLNLNIYLIALLSLLFSIGIGRFLYKSDLPSALMDMPCNRKIHTTPTPLVGGITVVFSTLIVIILFQLYINTEVGIFIVFSIYFIFVGLFDDLFKWNYMKKMLLQILGITLFIMSISSNISQLSLFSIYSHYKIINFIVVFLWILFIINAFNFFDGINFLAGSLAIIFFSSYAIYYYQLGEHLPFVLLNILIFSIIGFLVYNRAPAKMFLGDAGSMFLGFAIASFPIIFNSNNLNSFDLTFPLIVLFILISDTTFVVAHRIIKNKNPFYPDTTHLHHQLLNLKFRNRYVVIIIVVGAILHSILAFFALKIGLIWSVILIFLLNIIFVFVPRYLPALFSKYNLWGLKSIYDNIFKVLSR